MRAGSIDTYAERIARVIAFVEESIGQGRIPGLADMAAVAALSEFHFHRMFRLMTGETPAEAVSRIRLAAALGQLEQGDLAAAVEASGYATSQAFARALKDRIGASPSQLREDRGLLAKFRTSLAAPAASPATVPVPVTVEIATLQPIRLVTRRNVGDFRELNVGYGLLFSALAEHLQPSDIAGIYGIPWDDPRYVPAEQCRFDCAFDVGPARPTADTLTPVEIAGGSYAGLHHVGDYDDVHANIDALYAWALQEGRRIGDGPLFIQYLDDPEAVPPPQQRSISWLPLE